MLHVWLLSSSVVLCPFWVFFSFNADQVIFFNRYGTDLLKEEYRNKILDMEFKDEQTLETLQQLIQ